jgi:HTH-type transcriptional regulator / antitoxin HigA
VLPTEPDYEYAVALLDRLIDRVGEDETHPLASLMELVGLLVEKYEDSYVPEITSL